MTNHESGNRVIAEFMGMLLDEHGFIIRNPTLINIGRSHDLKFHLSWDWIMPVVEKIYLMREVTDFVIRMGEVEISIIGRGSIKSPCIISNNSITELWIAIVEFIEWHNTRLNNHTSSKSDL